ncbi:hypothetical protein, partial [Kitasatospora sp. GP82]|uniref:hypothetical protein n=1 Tax=Kitasatospora sp. GP82 TaxID=3035089 RepID=UPI0024753825
PTPRPADPHTLNQPATGDNPDLNLTSQTLHLTSHRAWNGDAPVLAPPAGTAQDPPRQGMDIRVSASR